MTMMMMMIMMMILLMMMVIMMKMMMMMKVLLLMSFACIFNILHYETIQSRDSNKMQTKTIIL